MIEWQNTIYQAVKPGILGIAQSLKESNPDMGFSGNFNVHWPNGFIAGESKSIPITIPSRKSGAIHVANAIIDVSMDSKIAGIGLRPLKTATPFDPSLVPENNERVTFTGTMNRFGSFLNDINKILFSDTMQSLVAPKVDIAIMGGGGGFNMLPPMDGSGGMIALDPRNSGIRLTDGPDAPVPWNQVRPSVLSAEQQRASLIKTVDEQGEFVSKALGSPSKAPRWYTALGGQQKEKMHDKIKEAYLQLCKSERKTFAPTLFFKRLSQNMLRKNQLAAYCERDMSFVAGTVNGQCGQRSCPVYDPNCRKLSMRINVKNN